MWVLKKAIYGLRISPRQWAFTRNNTVRGQGLEFADGVEGTFQPAESQEHVWMVVSQKGDIRAYALFYVDDILLAAKAADLPALHEKILEFWRVKDQGTLRNPADTTWNDVLAAELNPQSELSFLGMKLVFDEDSSLSCHQIPYIQSCLKQRGFHALKGSQSLPVISEGAQPEFDSKESSRIQDCPSQCTEGSRCFAVGDTAQSSRLRSSCGDFRIHAGHASQCSAEVVSSSVALLSRNLALYVAL